MPPLPATASPESPRLRLSFTALAAAVIAVFVVATHPFWVPAHPGDDQNAYLVSGKLLAAHFPPGLAVDDPYSFVGKMWVAAPDGRYYSKYPLGMPALVALALKVFGPARGMGRFPPGRARNGPTASIIEHMVCRVVIRSFVVGRRENVIRAETSTLRSFNRYFRNPWSSAVRR